MTQAPLPFYVTPEDPPAKRAAMAAAMTLFADHGIDAVTVRDIAAATGYTNPALFRHFPAKDALAQALFEAAYRRVLAAIGSGARADGLRGAIAAALDLIGEAPEAVHFVLENIRRLYRHLPAALRQTSVLGEMRRLVCAERGLDPAQALLPAAMVLGTLGQIARMHLFGELDRPPAALTDDLWRLFETGLKG